MGDDPKKEYNSSENGCGLWFLTDFPRALMMQRYFIPIKYEILRLGRL